MFKNSSSISNKFRIPIKQQVTDVFDKVGFILAFLLGLIGIIALKALHASQVWVTLLPVSVMLGYASMIYLCLRTRLGEDQSGDNLYYLGFLFTLVSLSFALYQFDGEGGNAVIIENFGIALSTTIAGLFLRILFNQMRHDPIEIEREARIELASTATRLRTDLLEVTHIMKGTLIAAQQQTAEVIITHSDHFKDLAETIFTKATDSHNIILENTEKLTQTTDTFISGVEKLVSRIDDINPPTNLLENKLAPAIESIQLASEEILNRVKHDELTIKQLTKLVKNAVTASGTLEEKLNTMSDQSDQVNKIFATLEQVSSKFEHSGQTFHHAAEQISTLSETQKQMHADINLLSTTTNDTILNGTETQKNAFAALEKSFTETVQSAKQHNEKLAEELERSRQYTESVHHSLVHMTDSLANKLAVNNETSRIHQVSTVTGE
jgi:hypothetical protein